MTALGGEPGSIGAEAKRRLEERRTRYEAAGEAEPGPEFDSYAQRFQALFDHSRLRDWVFAPFRAVFRSAGTVTEQRVRQTITGVALANAVLAGLPGKLGIGVAVCMALEAVMALRIAQHVGITNIRTPRDTLKLFGALGGTLVVIFWLFRQLLGVAFSLFNLVGLLPATFLAELFVTNMVGVLLWVGFRELKSGGSIRFPLRAGRFLVSETLGLCRHQASVLRGALRPSNLRTVGRRLWAWARGDVVLKPVRIKDDCVVAAAMASLLVEQDGALDGPMGREFLQSIRDLYGGLADADESEIADHMRSYDDVQMQGVLSQIKGRLHERLVVTAENEDGDAWIARLHDDPLHASTDMELENTTTGDRFAVSLKATDDPRYVEHALSRYPDDPVMATDEAAAHFEGDDRVSSSGMTNAELEQVTEENFEQLLEETEPTRLDAAAGAAVGTSLWAVIQLWPFVAAWQRKRITRAQLEAACGRLLGASGRRLVPRLVASLAFGPIYMWYVLARGVFSLSDVAHAAASA